MRPGVLRRAHDFAYAAKAIRKEAGLTQAEVASKAGVTPSWLSRFENGKHHVDFRSVIRVFTVLDCIFLVVPQPPLPDGLDIDVLKQPARDQRAARGSGG
ncbi:MAG TPA: hypothetical protein DEP66_06715 [Acidimicrobiaceae bacterium]|nr:hypothetical protein [Acidimicrobiaceae bacterium]HCB37876.1 hypothetical protein [Acidimicrobiaceae bacterium]